MKEMKLFETIFDLVTLPIEVVKDVFTLGGTATDQKKTYIRLRIEKLDEDVKNKALKSMKKNGEYI